MRQACGSSGRRGMSDASVSADLAEVAVVVAAAEAAGEASTSVRCCGCAAGCRHRCFRRGKHSSRTWVLSCRAAASHSSPVHGRSTCRCKCPHSCCPCCCLLFSVRPTAHLLAGLNGARAGLPRSRLHCTSRLLGWHWHSAPFPPARPIHPPHGAAATRHAEAHPSRRLGPARADCLAAGRPVMRHVLGD